MQKIRIVAQSEFAYPADVDRLVDALASAGYDATPEQAAQLWEMYSESMCASWMSMDGDTDDDLLSAVIPYFTGEDQ